MMMLLIASPLLITPQTDTHVPSFTLANNVVSFDAEWAWIDTQPANGSFELLDKNKQAITERIAGQPRRVDERLEWRLSPGEWRFVTLGHADDLSNPARQRREFVVNVTSSRDDQLRDIAQRYLDALRDFALIDATDAEKFQAIRDLLDPPTP